MENIINPSIHPAKVLEIKLNPKPGSVKFFVTMQYEAATIYGICIAENRGGGYTVLFPGKKSYKTIEFSQPVRSEIENLILDAAKAKGLI